MTDRWIALAGVWACYTLFGLVATSLAPLVARIEADLGLSHAAMGSVLGAWQLVYIFAAVPCGMLLDRAGERRALTLGVLLVCISALGRSLADSYVGLLVAVMAFGLGGPLISAGAPKVVTGLFTGSHRGFAMGIYMTGPAIGGIISLTLTHSVLLPLFADDWRRVFQLWAVTGLVVAGIWYLIAGRFAARLLDVHSNVHSDMTDNDDTAPVRASPGSLLRKRSVRLVLAMSVGVFLFNHGLNNWLPELLRAKGMSAITAGYWAALPTVIGIAGSLIIPRLATPQRRFAILLALCVAALIASLLLQFDARGGFVPGLILQGIARSALMTVLILTLVELPGIGDRHAGTASGLFFSAAEIGGVLGPLGLGLLYDVTGGFSAGLYALTAVAVLLGLGSARLQQLAQREDDP